MTRARSLKITLVAAIFILAVAVRLYRLTSVPAGLHRDEMSEMYEAFALLKTGADRWGYHWPLYFLSWGSGQNVLQSYLSIPVVAITGLTTLGTRFVTAVFGVLMLPLFFIAMRRWYGDIAATAGLIFLAFSPWHIMLSRWGIENNQLPFLILLGIYLFDRALDSKSTAFTLVSLLPFAVALYSYGVFVLILPILLILLAIGNFQKIRTRWPIWLGALAIFAVAAAPIGFFTFKNYVTKHNYAFESHLPVSIPLTPNSRLSEARWLIGNARPYRFNLSFIHHLFQDPVESWFNVPSFPPLPRIVLALTLIGLVVVAIKTWRTRRLQDLSFCWLVSCLPIFFFFPLNISRAIALFLPLIVMAGVGFQSLWERSPTTGLRIALTVITIVCFVVPTARFLPRYFGASYADAISRDFRPEMPKALDELNRLSASALPMYVTDSIPLTYVDVLFYRKVDPYTFQHSGATWKDPDFGRYHFGISKLPESTGPFAFLLLQSDSVACKSPANVEMVGQFVVGMCPRPDFRLSN